jgi:hypothetical protein
LTSGVGHQQKLDVELQAPKVALNRW